jgi:hypothetical protein
MALGGVRRSADASARASPPVEPPLPRVTTIVAPLLVLGVVGFIVVQALPSGSAALEREKTALRARVGVRKEREALLEDLRKFARAHRDDVESVRFSTGLFARLHATKDFAETFADDRARARRPGEAKAFAAATLRALSYDVDEPEKISWMFPRAMQALVEAGDADAKTELRGLIAKLGRPKPDGSRESTEWTLPIYAAAHRTPSAARDLVIEAWEQRPDYPELVAAAATLRTWRGDRRHDALMRTLILEGSNGRRFFWRHVVRAFGTGGTAEHARYLAEQRAKVVDDSPEARTHIEAFDIGLAMTGDAEAAKRARAAILPKDDAVGVNWAVGLCTQLIHGERDAAKDLATLWDVAGDPTRLQIGVGVLLADPLPPDGAAPYDDWAARLSQGPSRVAKTVAHAWRYRRRAARTADGLDDLLDDLVGAAREMEASPPTIMEADHSSALIEVLRALVRWGS